jgi:hypothetical protein
LRFPLNIADYLGYRIFGRDLDEHMDMIDAHMTFQYFTLLLLSQLMQSLTQILSQLPVQDLSAAFWYPHYMVLAVPYAVL